MKLIVLSALLALAAARVVENKITGCNGIIINGINHEKEVLKDNVDKPSMMSIDYNTNVLFYSYLEPESDAFTPATLDLKTKESYDIPGAEGGSATSVDPKTHKTYIGGNDGIYELDYQNNVTTKLDITTDNIWQVFAKDGVIYYTTFPDEYAFVYKNGKRENIAGIGNNKALVVGLDKEDNIFFSNTSGLFLRPKNDDKVVKVGQHAADSFAADANGKLYFSTGAGIFTLNEVTNNKVKVSKLTGKIKQAIIGVVIESDGSLIYADRESINRLKSTGQVCSKQH